MKRLVAFFLLCSVVCAEKPTADIRGPTERNPGALTFLDASGSTADNWSWLVDTSSVKVPEDGTPDVSETVEQLRALGFEVQEPQDESEPLWAVSDDGKRLWLSSYPGTYAVVLGVSNADGVVLKPWRVVVKGTPPKPEPPPDPDNPDPPDPDVPLSALASKVASAVKPKTAAHAEFLDVADVYDAIGAMAAAGALSSPDEVVTMTATLSRSKLPTHLSDWQQVVTTVIGPHLNALAEAGKLETAADHAEPWTDIAAGIRKGAK